jgi:hypothetical protein
VQKEVSQSSACTRPRIIKLLYLLAYIYAPRNRKSRILKYNHRARRLGSSRIALAPCRRLSIAPSLFVISSCFFQGPHLCFAFTRCFGVRDTRYMYISFGVPGRSGKSNKRFLLFPEMLYRFRLHRNYLTAENTENTEGDKRDEYRTMKGGFDIALPSDFCVISYSFCVQLIPQDLIVLSKLPLIIVSPSLLKVRQVTEA